MYDLQRRVTFQITSAYASTFQQYQHHTVCLYICEYLSICRLFRPSLGKSIHFHTLLIGDRVADDLRTRLRAHIGHIEDTGTGLTSLKLLQSILLRSMRSS